MEQKDTPFSIVKTKAPECQFGPQYYKETPSESCRVKVQGIHRIGCHAHIIITKCVFYPNYKVHDEGTKICTLKKRGMEDLKQQLENDVTLLQIITAYLVSMPTQDAHYAYPTGEGVAGFSQRMNETVAAK